MEAPTRPIHFLTREDVAAQLNVCVDTVDHMIRRGEIPAFKVGTKLVRIPDTYQKDTISFITLRDIDIVEVEEEDISSEEIDPEAIS